MLYKIILSGKDYWYDPEWLTLHTDEAGTSEPVKTRFLSDDDLREFYSQKYDIDRAFKLSKQ